MENNQIEKPVTDACGKIEELQFLLHIDATPLTETIVKRAVEDFIKAAHIIENAPTLAFYDKEIEHFNMYMWRIRDHALDIMNSWLKRHDNEVRQDDPVLERSCRKKAIKTAGNIQFENSSGSGSICAQMK